MTTSKLLFILEFANKFWVLQKESSIHSTQEYSTGQVIAEFDTMEAARAYLDMSMTVH